ncbi:hypothetical protein EG832_05010 [bacterium]|nr:hypothetical protein [bacterium]
MDSKKNKGKPEEVVIVESVKALPVIISGVLEAPPKIQLLPFGVGILQMIGDIEDDGLLNGSAQLLGGAY